MILEGYIMGPWVRRLLAVYWDSSVMAEIESGYYGYPFQGYRGVTQGGLLSSWIFNVFVDAIVRHWSGLATENKAEPERGSATP